MNTLYVVWIATEDDGKPSTRRIFYTATSTVQRAIQAANAIGGTITMTTEYTPEELIASGGPIMP